MKNKTKGADFEEEERGTNNTAQCSGILKNITLNNALLL